MTLYIGDSLGIGQAACQQAYSVGFFKNSFNHFLILFFTYSSNVKLIFKSGQIKIWFAQSAGAVEYTDCFSAEG